MYGDESACRISRILRSVGSSRGIESNPPNSLAIGIVSKKMTQKRAELVANSSDCAIALLKPLPSKGETNMLERRRQPASYPAAAALPALARKSALVLCAAVTGLASQGLPAAAGSRFTTFDPPNSALTVARSMSAGEVTGNYQ